MEIAAITKIFEKPILLKNVVNSMRIESLGDIFDKSTFIVIRRDKLDNAQSILNARISLHNNKNHRWSVITPSMRNNPGLPFYKDIFNQLSYFEALHLVLFKCLVAFWRCPLSCLFCLFY